MLGMMTRHIRQANVGASRLELAQVIVRNLLLSAGDTPGFSAGITRWPNAPLEGRGAFCRVPLEAVVWQSCL